MFLFFDNAGPTENTLAQRRVAVRHVFVRRKTEPDVPKDAKFYLQQIGTTRTRFTGTVTTSDARQALVPPMRCRTTLDYRSRLTLPLGGSSMDANNLDALRKSLSHASKEETSTTWFIFDSRSLWSELNWAGTATKLGGTTASAFIVSPRAIAHLKVWTSTSVVKEFDSNGSSLFMLISVQGGTVPLLSRDNQVISELQRTLVHAGMIIASLNCALERWFQIQRFEHHEGVFYSYSRVQYHKAPQRRAKQKWVF